MRIKRSKRKKSLHIVILSAVLIAISVCTMRVDCYAASEESSAVSSEIDGIIEDFEEAIPNGLWENLDIGSVSESLSIKSLLSAVLDATTGQGGALLEFLLSIIGVILIGAVASGVNSNLSPYVSRAIGVVSAAMILERLIFLFEGVASSLSEISQFFAAVIPVTLAVNSLGISPTTASTQAVGMGVTLGAYSFIGQALLIPIVSAVFISSAASSIDPLFDRIAKGVKGLFITLMGAFTVLVGASFSLQSVISSSADSIVIRSARYAAAGSIPIVGNTVSGALGLVSGGVAYARGIVGGGAIAVIVALIISPLITLLLYRACLKLGVFLASLSSASGCESVTLSFPGAVDTLIATYSLSALIYVVELVAFLKGGVSVA